MRSFALRTKTTTYNRPYSLKLVSVSVKNQTEGTDLRGLGPSARVSGPWDGGGGDGFAHASTWES